MSKNYDEMSEEELREEVEKIRSSRVKRTREPKERKRGGSTKKPKLTEEEKEQKLRDSVLEL